MALRRPAWSQSKWAAVRLSIYERDGYACLTCGWTPSEVPAGYDGRRALGDVFCVVKRGRRVLTFRVLDMDHIVPISMGGTNDASNFQTLCNSCNSRKHTTSAATA